MITHDLRVLADAMQDKKGQNVISIDLRAIEGAIADFFMVCHADSTPNVDAICQNVKEKMAEEGHRLLRSQGEENRFWIILDYGNILAHIFLKEYREFYRLEDLWADAPHKTYRERAPYERKKKDKKSKND